jgi:hypothetical protein
MERVFIGATRAEATRMADEWWAHQKGLRQSLRTEVAVGRTRRAARSMGHNHPLRGREPMTNRIASLRAAGSSTLQVAPSSIAVCGLASFPCKRSYLVSRFYTMVA